MRDSDPDGDGEGEALRQLVVEAVNQCTDLNLLDLVYLLITKST